MPRDPLLAQLLSSPQDEALRDLAYHYAPCIRFDTHEPFLPLAAGYTVFTQDDPSPSYTKGRTIQLAPSGEARAATAIEYAIWWDWDIGHLYELEHVWVYVGSEGRVVRGEASWHGSRPEYHLHTIRSTKWHVGMKKCWKH